MSDTTYEADRDTVISLLYMLARSWLAVLAAHNCPRNNAIFARAAKPQVGDLVLESTHNLGCRNADIEAGIGFLVRVDHLRIDRDLPPGETWDEAAEGRPCPLETVYTINDLAGRQFTWTNARLVSLPLSLGALDATDIDRVFRLDPNGSELLSMQAARRWQHRVRLLHLGAMTSDARTGRAQ